MPIKLIGLDLDGTTLNSKKQLSERTKATLARACTQGVTVLPVTGRPRAGIPAEILSIPGIRYAITSNGGAAYDLQLGQELLTHPINKQAARRVLEYADAFGAIADIYANGWSYTSAATFQRLVDLAPAVMKEYFLTSRIPVEDQRRWLVEEAGPIEKITLFFADKQCPQNAWGFFEECGDFEVTNSSSTNLELNQKGVDKGFALLALAQRLGIRREEILACGDARNDISMLQAAGTGVAMGNAAPEVLAAACHHTASNDEDGVAKAIERYAWG